MYTHLLFEHAAPIAPNMTELGAYMMKVGAQTAMFDLVKFLEVGETTVHCVKLNDESPYKYSDCTVRCWCNSHHPLPSLPMSVVLLFEAVHVRHCHSGLGELDRW